LWSPWPTCDLVGSREGQAQGGEAERAARAQGGEGGARRRLQLVVDEARLTLSLFFLLVATLVIKCERL
jgi:hypothetical protein